MARGSRVIGSRSGHQRNQRIPAPEPTDASVRQRQQRAGPGGLPIHPCISLIRRSVARRAKPQWHPRASWKPVYWLCESTLSPLKVFRGIAPLDLYRSSVCAGLRYRARVRQLRRIFRNTLGTRGPTSSRRAWPPAVTKSLWKNMAGKHSSSSLPFAEFSTATRAFFTSRKGRNPVHFRT